MTLACSHRFCDTCILAWQSAALDRNETPSCPLCREELSFAFTMKVSGIQIYLKRNWIIFTWSLILKFFFQRKWIPAIGEAYSTTCAYCRVPINYRDERGYLTSDKCDHRLCFPCMKVVVEYSLLVKRPFKCPICFQRFSYALQYQYH